MAKKPEFDESLISKLASIHCTEDEIASVSGCPIDVLQRQFSGVIKEAKDKGRANLRRYQWEAAQKGNAAMLSMLGKQILGQNEATRIIELDEIPDDVLQKEVERRLRIVGSL